MPCLPSDKLGQQRACLIFIFLAPGKILETDEGGRGGGGGVKTRVKLHPPHWGKVGQKFSAQTFVKVG